MNSHSSIAFLKADAVLDYTILAYVLRKGAIVLECSLWSDITGSAVCSPLLDSCYTVPVSTFCEEIK